MLEAISTPSTAKEATPKRRELTVADVSAVLRLDPSTGYLHWLKAPKGCRREDLRAGCDLKRDGRITCRVVTIAGTRYREHHVVHLLQHGAWPASKRTLKRTRKASTSPAVETPIAAATVATPAPPKPTPAPVVPRPELSRAAIAKARPEHRGWLLGAAKFVSRAITA